MSVEVLIATMHRENLDFLGAMNIQSDAIVINQCDRNDFESIKYNDHVIRHFSFNERGVGLSRNSALMRAGGDIILFADDDVTYVDNYEQIIEDAFSENPDADMIFFNFKSQNPERPEYLIPKKMRVRKHNSLRYGAIRIAVRRSSLYKSSVTFSLLFGGGSRYSSGEDSLFIYKSISSGLRVYAVPELLGTVTQEESTWFEGYTDKFFKDKGALFRAISSLWAPVYCVYYVLRNYKTFHTTKNPIEVLSLMRAGSKEYSDE